MRTRLFRATFSLVMAVLSASPMAAGAQVPGFAPASAFDSTHFTGLTYRNVGPVRGGRSIAVSGSTSRPLEYYFGATGGGLWKTTDGGTTWRAVTDGQITSSSVGAIGQCEKNPDVVYIGMGEVQLRGNIMQGDGVYKSTDAGKTWTHSGLRESQAIGRLRVHPDNCELVYAAVLGHPYGPHPERGVFRSRDGGASWEKVLYRNDTTGAVDLVIDPTNPGTLYASFWQVHRTPWSLSSGGPDGGLFKSTDGGDTWTELTANPGLPAGPLGKIGVAVSPADPNRVWAIIEAAEGGVFRSDDAGATWTRTNDERKLRQRAFYYTRIYADPKDKDVVYVQNVGFFRSKDGGKTFPKQIRVPHSDNHDLWIAADDPDRMVEGNDGGGNVSFNGGQTWTDQDYPTAQLYHIIATNHVPYWVCGAQQDNSTACMRSRGWPQMAPHVAVGGGESGYIASDPENPNIFYAGNYGGTLSRFDYETGQRRSINVWPENPMGHSASDIRERFQWTFPIVFSRTGPKTLYVGSQHLWKSTTEGMSWERISGDLTRADPKTLGPSGGPITLDQTGVETYATIFTIAPSPHDANTIWTGSDDGLIHLTRDGGSSWQNVTPAGIPEFMRISMIEVSPHRPATAYVAGKRHQLDDRTPYVYRTDDFGRTWTRTNQGIADGHFVHAVREDPVRAGLLFAGTEHGVYVSLDNGASWRPLNRNLPDVQVPDLVVKDDDLVIATHGRSAYIMDDISALRQLSPAVAAAPFHLFDPADAVRGIASGVAINYYLAAAADTVTIEILNAAGNVVRTFGASSDTTRAKGDSDDDEEEDEDDGPRGRAPRVGLKAGMNRFVWDTRHEGPTTFEGMILWAAGRNGPRALPGNYTVRVNADGKSQSQQFALLPDPRNPHVTTADLQAQYDFAIQIRDEVSRANDAVLLIRGIKKQIDERVAQDSTLLQDAEALKEKLTAVEGEIYQYRNQSNQDPLNYPIKLNNKIAALLGAVENVEGRPTAQSYEVFRELSARLDVQIAALERLLESDLAVFNTRLRERGAEPVQRQPLEEEST